ncbi:MAG: Hsp20/alpha crystallin family protein [Clostridia bacterium]|nr:Hsp20/alpha crystallin family protein [Clostridia bacterium]
MLNRNHELAYWDPFRDLDEIEKHFFGAPQRSFAANDFGAFKTDIKDEGDKYVIEADMPGFNKEDIKVDLNGDVMTISAERHSEHEDKDKKSKYIRCERSYGMYRRQFDVSEINVESIDGKYENGVLTLELPKKTPAAPVSRRLELK